MKSKDGGVAGRKGSGAGSGKGLSEGRARKFDIMITVDGNAT
jgi:hypothetical protein